jgi:hypothetical protein
MSDPSYKICGSASLGLVFGLFYLIDFEPTSPSVRFPEVHIQDFI